MSSLPSTMKTHLFLAALGFAASAFAQTPAAPAATPAPEDAAALNQQSIESLKNKDAQGAVALAERATKADPTRPEYFSQLGIALSQRMNEVPFMQMAVMSGKLKRAFEKSVALDANHVPGLIGLARFYTNAPEIAGGSLEKAAEFAARLRQIDPFLGALELGNIASKDEKYAEALAHYEAAAKLKPDHAGVLVGCGRVLVKLDRKDEARTRFAAALKLKPDLESAKKALAELDQPAN